jgi:hypothetical protein
MHRFMNRWRPRIGIAVALSIFLRGLSRLERLTQGFARPSGQ